ncbi:MAG TPA: hypothetical protein VNQ77_02540 [Frankiaceae bacterium]|nr:hypothetical protein [Frankiaceae bacterium]
MRPGRVVGIVAGLFATFVLVLGSIPATRARAERLLVLTVVLYAGFAARRMLGVGERPHPTPQPRHGESEPAEEQDVRLARLDASLARGAESGEQFWRVTRPALQRLTTERLRVGSGIDVTADPVGARQRMGEELWAMFSMPAGHAGPAPGPERLRRLVEHLERL